MLADIKPEFRCDDEAMHSRIREGFGNTELVKVRDDTSGKMRAS